MNSRWSALEHIPPREPPAGLPRRFSPRGLWICAAAAAAVAVIALAALLDPRNRAGFNSSSIAFAPALQLGPPAMIVVLAGWAVRLRAENRRLRAEHAARMRRHSDRLQGLLNVSQSMAAEIDVQSVFDTITTTCLGLFQCDRVSLMVVESTEPDADLILRSAAGLENPGALLGQRHPIGTGVAGAVARTRRPLVLGSNPFPDRPAGEHPDARRLSASMVVPILVRGELVGVVSVATERAGARYDDDDVRALQVFAENAGTSIRHAEQSHWMRETITALRAPA